MYCVTYIVRNWYDSWLGCRHDATFTGAIFESLDEIKKWQVETPDVEVYKVENLKTAEIIKL